MKFNTLKWSFLLIMVLFCNHIIAQSGFFSAKKDTTLLLKKEQTRYLLDSLDILPATVSIALKDSSTIEYTLDRGFLIFPSKELNKRDSTSVDISFEVLNSNFAQSYSHLDTNILNKKDAFIYIGYDNQQVQKRNNSIITEKGIDYDGSFARGFSMGNSQSLLLNSNFNMQLAGDLGEGIRVKAAISDDNIPIQPEGNTRLLQEFDKVYIEVSKDKNSITAGDYELRRPESYFINYDKQLKGLSGYNEYTISQQQEVKTRASFAVSRAKFNRYTLPVIEGNQGPYKLIGGNGERFIIIESGSEKVYEDGQLLTRGQNNDYVISYDQAEIIFTEKKLITSASRIIVEYEYVDRNFLRTMYALESKYSYKNLGVKLNYYSLQDSKNTTSNPNLDSTSLEILGNSGDDLSRLRRSGIRLFDGDRDPSIITYKLISDSILVYSINPDSAIYTAFFSEVLDGTGTYDIDESANANGRVYKFVGLGNGNYIPEIQLVAPEKTAMMSLGIKYEPTKNTLLSSEFALSDFDLNRFSALDNNDNQGRAINISLAHQFIVADSINSSTFEPFLNVEFTEEHFRFINPYRENQEFNRDWNISPSLPQADQLLFNTGLAIKRNNTFKSKYKYSQYDRKSFYSGKRHSFDLEYQFLGFRLNTKNSLVSSDDDLEKTQFFRPDISLSRGWNNNTWTTEIRYWAEQNQRTLIASDSLNQLSQSFKVMEALMERKIGEKFTGRIVYKDRKDQGIADNTFVPLSHARDILIGSTWKQSKSGRLILDFTIRDFEILNNDITTLQSKRSYLGQLTYSNKFWGGAINTQTSYNLGSGQQAKIEYDYQEVLPGEGNFDWIDFNNDGIEQINEFRISTFQDTAKYIRLALYNNEFIQTNNAIVNQSLRLDPKLFFLHRKKQRKQKEKEAKEKEAKTALQKKKTASVTKDQKDAKKLKSPKKDKKKKKDPFLERALSRLSIVSNVRVNKKVSLDGQKYNPFNLSQNDTTIVNSTANLNNTIFINRGSPGFDMQIGNRYNQTKLVQISGLEGRGLAENYLRIRKAVSKSLDLIFAYNWGHKTGFSENFLDKNFDVAFTKIAPQINYRPSTNSRIIIAYSNTHKNEILLQQESLTNNDLSFEFSFRQTSKASWDFGLKYAQVRFDSDQNTSIAFELLEGLKPGKNYIWNNSYTRRLSGNIDLIINYEGRKNGTNKVVHTARAQVKATF